MATQVGSRQDESGFWYITFDNRIAGDSWGFDTRADAQACALKLVMEHQARLAPAEKAELVYQP